MFQYKCLNPISACGTSLFTEEYKQVEELQEADAVLVRSAAMHDMQDVPNLLAVARAGAGVNNIPIADYSDKGIVVFNTPGANANGVKEMVIAGMLLASRDLIGGNKWVEENTSAAKKRAFFTPLCLALPMASRTASRLSSTPTTCLALPEAVRPMVPMPQ